MELELKHLAECEPKLNVDEHEPTRTSANQQLRRIAHTHVAKLRLQMPRLNQTNQPPNQSKNHKPTVTHELQRKNHHKNSYQTPNRS